MKRTIPPPDAEIHVNGHLPPEAARALVTIVQDAYQDAKYIATPPYEQPGLAQVQHRVLCERHHELDKTGRCRVCRERRPIGGWLVCRGKAGR